MSETKPKSISGATEVAGVQYLPGTKGMLVPVANIKAKDLLQHEMVYQLTDYALDLSAEVARFNGHSRADLAQFDALLAQEYGVTRDTEFKGNRTYTSADGKRQVKIAMSDRVSYGPGLQAAKALLDELITENAAGAGPVLTPLVNLAFRVDKEGKVDPNLLRAIKRLEIPDPRWSEIVRAINEAEQPLDSASYVRFYRAGPTGKMELIPLDIAAAFPTPEAFERRSLRRQVEELNARLAGDPARAALLGLVDQLKDLKKAFGAPGNYGYSTPEGKALYALYSSPGWAAAHRIAYEAASDASEHAAE